MANAWLILRHFGLFFLIGKLLVQYPREKIDTHFAIAPLHQVFFCRVITYLLDALGILVVFIRVEAHNPTREMVIS